MRSRQRVADTLQDWRRPPRAKTGRVRASRCERNRRVGQGSVLRNEPMSNLERAIAIAVEAHAGQRDKAGAPYILHPLRVMLRLTSDNERVVGVLHDVCEDCPGWTLDRLRAEGFSEQVLTALDSVTKRDDETYEDFVSRAAENPIGRAVKLSDLQDNCDLSRISKPSDRDFARIEKYKKAIALMSRLASAPPK